MRGKSVAAPIGGTSLTTGSPVLLSVFVGAYFYVFLGSSPVAGVTRLYTLIGLDGMMSLDAFMALGHAAAYAFLTLLLCTIFRSASARPPIAATLTGIGVGMEVLQEEVFGRQFQLGDVLANVAGIVVVLVLLKLTRRTHRIRR